MGLATERVKSPTINVHCDTGGSAIKFYARSARPAIFAKRRCPICRQARSDASRAGAIVEPEFFEGTRILNDWSVRLEPGRQSSENLQSTRRGHLGSAP